MSLVRFQAKNHRQQIAARGGSDDAIDDRATTPEDFAWFNTLGPFTLDVAAAPHNTKCQRYFTFRDNGLRQSWAGERIWCNLANHRHADRDWTLRALCRGADPELFFPPRGPGKASRPYVTAVRDVQRRYCHNGCPVTTECLNYALQLDIRFGIYGGIPEDERPNGGRQ